MLLVLISLMQRTVRYNVLWEQIRKLIVALLVHAVGF
jgi:hypothetical protein